MASSVRLKPLNCSRLPCVYAQDIFFSSRRRHTRYWRDWSSDVCSSDLQRGQPLDAEFFAEIEAADLGIVHDIVLAALHEDLARIDDVGPVGEVERLAHVMVGDEHADAAGGQTAQDRKSVV